MVQICLIVVFTLGFLKNLFSEPVIWQIFDMALVCQY